MDYNKLQPVKVTLGVIAVALLAYIAFGSGGGGINLGGAIEIPTGAIGTSTVVTVTSTIAQATSALPEFPARPQALKRVFTNECANDIYISIGTSTPLIRGQGGLLLRASSTNNNDSILEMTAEKGNLERGDVFASSTGTCTNGLRLYQVP